MSPVHGTDARPDPHCGNLPLILASPAAVRERHRDEITRRFASADQDALADFLAFRSLLPLLGGRLIELAPDAVGASFREHVQADLALTQRRSVGLEFGLRDVVTRLEAAGVKALPLKGVALAVAAHGDPGVRPSSDIDVLVRRADLSAAIGVLTAEAYEPPADPAWVDGLPLLHYTLEPRRPGGAPVELHWRIHWGEEAFSQELLDNSEIGSEGWRRPQPLHEFAELLLFYARDGFSGLRLPVDLVAWWDRHGSLVPDRGLEEISTRHPALRRSLAAAVSVLAEHFELPVARLLEPRPLDRSAARAAALADPLATSSVRDFESRLMLVDALLSPGQQKVGFARRYYFQPLGEVRQTYGLQNAPSVVVQLRRLAHAVGGPMKSTPGLVSLLLRSRPRRAADHQSFGPLDRLRLSAEVVSTYARVRLLMWRRTLPDALDALRRPSRRRVVDATDFRVAYIVERVLRFLPTDTRCLMKSLVLLGMLQRREVSTKLVLGTSPQGKFEAHAWIEREGEALLWSGGGAFGRLTEL